MCPILPLGGGGESQGAPQVFVVLIQPSLTHEFSFRKAKAPKEGTRTLYPPALSLEPHAGRVKLIISAA